MRKLTLALAAATAVIGGSATAGTAPAAPAPMLFSGVYDPASPPALDHVQWFWGGRNYCWYDGGWRGPGFYWCGYAWRRGYGWGGGYGWRGWRGGHPSAYYHGGGWRDHDRGWHDHGGWRGGDRGHDGGHGDHDHGPR
jgi:hypothetical protein